MATKRKTTEDEVTIRVARRRLGGVDDGDDDVFWPEPSDLCQCTLVLKPGMRAPWDATRFGVERERHHDDTWCVKRLLYEDRHGVVITLQFTPLSCDPADQESALELAAHLLASLIKERFSLLSPIQAECYGTDLIKTAREVLLDFAAVIANDGVEFIDQTVDELAHFVCKVAVGETAGEHVLLRFKENSCYPKEGVGQLETVTDYVELSAEPGEAQ